MSATAQTAVTRDRRTDTSAALTGRLTPAALGEILESLHLRRRELERSVQYAQRNGIAQQEPHAANAAELARVTAAIAEVDGFAA